MRFLIQHPPLRVITALLAIIAGVSIQHSEALLLLLVLGQCWLAVCRVPVQFFWRKLRLVLPYVFFSFLFFILYEPATYHILFDLVPLSVYGLEKAFIYAARLMFAIQMLTLLFYQLPYPIFFQSLLRLKVPGIFAELILFTLRFMEVIRVEAVIMLHAMRSRGMKSRNFFSLKYYLILSRLLGSLLARSLHRSERVYGGMMSRGYQGVQSVPEMYPLRIKDWIWAAIWVIPVYAVLISELY